MARNLESELARLSRTVRRRAMVQTPRGERVRSAAPLSAADRIALVWEQTGGRFLRWIQRPWR
jgi:hypothetical protein